MTRIVKIHYQDHHTETIALAQASEQPSCLCSAIGEVIYEDDQWIRLCHGRNGIDEKDEDLEVIAVRKADVTTIQELRPVD